LSVCTLLWKSLRRKHGCEDARSFIGQSSALGDVGEPFFSVDESFYQLREGEIAMSGEMRRDRSPGMKLFFAGLVGFVLMVPLMMVYWLVWDRQDQSSTAQASINAGWGGAQVLAGPLLVVPYKTTERQTETIDGKSVTRNVEVERLLYISPVTNQVQTEIEPNERRKSIYSSVLYEARIKGRATFELPADLPRFGLARETLEWDRAELRMGASDARGLTTGGTLTADGKALAVEPGKGPAATSGQGFFAFLPWDGTGRLDVDYGFGLRGSRTLSLVPRGGQTSWKVSSSWPSPSFGGDFLPQSHEISETGFKASYTVDKLALGLPPVASDDLGPPQVDDGGEMNFYRSAVMPDGGGQSLALTVGLVEPVDLYSKVDRSVKYGFLFIGFTFLAFLLFDVVGGAKVASAEYLRAAAGLCRGDWLHSRLSRRFGRGDRPADRLQRRRAQELAARALHRRAAGGSLCAAVRALEPRGLVAADRLGAALRGSRRSDVCDPQRRLEQCRQGRA